MNPDREASLRDARRLDAPAIRLLGWIFAFLLVLNVGGLFAIDRRLRGGDGLFAGPGHSYAVGLGCAVAGAVCWTIAYRLMSRDRSRNGTEPSLHDDPVSRSQAGELARVFGALAIMLWVGALTSFTMGLFG